MLDVFDRDGARPLVPGQKAHRDRVATGRREGHTSPIRPIAQQGIWHLDQAPGPVADEGIRPDRAAMVEID